MSKTILAGELTAGMVAVERDGYLIDVLAVVRETPKTITVRLLARSSISMREPAEMTLRKSARVRIAGTEI